MKEQQSSRLVMVSVMVTEEQKDLLERRKEECGVPISFSIREALSTWLVINNENRFDRPNSRNIDMEVLS